MKQKIKIAGRQLFLAMVLFCSSNVFSQNFPYGFNYQAVVRDANGSARTNTAVSVRISIISTSSTNPINTYQAVYSAITNAL